VTSDNNPVSARARALHGRGPTGRLAEGTWRREVVESKTAETTRRQWAGVGTLERYRGIARAERRRQRMEQWCDPGSAYRRFAGGSYPSAMNADVLVLAEQALPILRRYGVTRAGVFGSRARGESKGDSDLDILVERVCG